MKAFDEWVATALVDIDSRTKKEHGAFTEKIIGLDILSLGSFCDVVAKRFEQHLAVSKTLGCCAPLPKSSLRLLEHCAQRGRRRLAMKTCSKIVSEYIVLAVKAVLTECWGRHSVLHCSSSVSR